MLIGMAKQKVLVSERALIQRVNRKLKAEDQKLKATRGFWDKGRNLHYEDTNLGWFYIIDVQRNFVVADHVDLAHLARQLGAMAKWEELAPEG